MAEEQPAWVLKRLEENPDCEEYNCAGQKVPVYCKICRQEARALSGVCRSTNPWID